MSNHKTLTTEESGERSMALCSISDPKEVARRRRSRPARLLRQMADQLTEMLSTGADLCNTDTNREYDRKHVEIVRDVLDYVLGRNSMESPLDAAGYW